MPLEASTVWPLDFQPGNPGRKPPTFRLGARPPGQRKGRQRRGGIGREAQVSAGATVVPAPDDPQTEPAPPSRAQGRGWETRYCLAHLPPPRVQVRPVPDNPSEAGSLALGTATRAAHWTGLPFPSPMRESEVTQLCPTLSDPMDCSPPGSSVHGIFQARVLEWGAIAYAFTLGIVSVYLFE